LLYDCLLTANTPCDPHLQCNHSLIEQVAETLCIDEMAAVGDEVTALRAENARLTAQLLASRNEVIACKEEVIACKDALMASAKELQQYRDSATSKLDKNVGDSLALMERSSKRQRQHHNCGSSNSSSSSSSSSSVKVASPLDKDQVLDYILVLWVAVIMFILLACAGVGEADTYSTAHRTAHQHRTRSL
jgi:hypothetical protein